jgi:hypothetical protein
MHRLYRNVKDEWEGMWMQADVAHFYILSYHKRLRKTTNTVTQNTGFQAQLWRLSKYHEGVLITQPWYLVWLMVSDTLITDKCLRYLKICTYIPISAFYATIWLGFCSCYMKKHHFITSEAQVQTLCTYEKQKWWIRIKIHIMVFYEVTTPCCSLVDWDQHITGNYYLDLLGLFWECTNETLAPSCKHHNVVSQSRNSQYKE